MGQDSQCPLVAVSGTIVVVGPVELDVDDATYRYLVIRDKTGGLRDFTMVRAAPHLSELIELESAGVFLFWDTPAECRLWCIIAQQ